MNFVMNLTTGRNYKGAIMGFNAAIYALSKKYTDNTTDALGGVKGAPATIKSITEIDGGHRVTFEWTGTSGKKETSTLDVINGVDGKQGTPGVAGKTPVKGVDYFDGEKGDDGFSPVITIAEISGGHKVTITTANGEESFDIMDGKDGTGSSTGEDNVIESIKVNGVAQTVAEDKSVDITVPTVDVDKNYVDTELAKKANTSDIPSLDGYVTDEELTAKGYLTSHQDIGGKVDKIKGKSLIANTEIERLKSVKNYDDTEIKTELAKKANSTDVTKEISDKIAEVISDAPESFNTLKEISDWISGHENDASAMNSAIKDNKNAITTLQTDKADKTEIPTVPTNVSDFTNDAGYLTEHQDISNLVVKEEGKGLSSNDYTSEEKTKLGGVGTSQGRNLIPYPLTNRITNGITYTVQSDGSVLANGTASAENNAYYNFVYKTLKLGDTSYTLSCEGLPKSVYVYVYDETIGKAVANVSDTPVAKTFVGDSTHTYSLSINVGKGTPVFNLAIKPILEMGTIAHAYEPISESNVNLKDAIDKVSTSQGSSQGRNLISYPYYNGTSFESNGVTYTVNEVDGTITVNGKATKESDFRLISPYDTSDRKILELGQTYTLSDGVNQSNSIGYQAPVYFQFVRIDATKNDFNYGISTNYGNMTWTANDANLLQYGIRIVVRSGVTVDNVVMKPMLEIGAIAHMYEPTTESNISLKSAIDGKADKSKVADVNWTSVDISSVDENTSAGATINYCIKNGICYMSILNIGFKTANQAIILGANSIPKPSSDYCWCPLVCVADPSYSVLIHPNLSGGLEHHVVGLISQVYSGLFSYPVAES